MTREGWLARVREEEQAIIATEGRWTVNGRYYSHEANAALQRRWEAEVRASRAIARDVLRQQGCAWCGKPFTESQPSVRAAGAEIHAVPSNGEFAEFTSDDVSRIQRRIA
jgi:hypothetical protein